MVRLVILFVMTYRQIPNFPHSGKTTHIDGMWVWHPIIEKYPEHYKRSQIFPLQPQGDAIDMHQTHLALKTNN